MVQTTLSHEKEIGEELHRFTRRSYRQPGLQASLWIPGLVLAGFLAVLVFSLFGPTVRIGFLLDDFLHIDYVYRASIGDPSGLIKALTGVWSGDTDALTTFRPGITISLVLDYLTSGFNIVGYHITNLSVFWGCALLTAALAFELGGLRTHIEKLAMAALASVLFTTYPLHVESVAWITARVDVHCTFFYLASLYTYFLFRRLGSPLFLPAALLFSLASLSCKEMAVSIPVVVAMAELLLANRLHWRPAPAGKRLFYAASFFAVLACFAVVRTLAIGTLVGGYGTSSWDSIRQAIANFSDKATISKIVYGVNEHRPLPQFLTTIARSCWLILAGTFLLGLIRSVATRWNLLFLTAWMLISCLPTFQIWHIFPNLVGSRLFFLGSVPLCLILATVAVPTSQPPLRNGWLEFGRSLLRNLILGAAIVLAAAWSVALVNNLKPYLLAGQQMDATRQVLRKHASLCPENKKVLLVDLPQDFEGAGMIGRPELLETAMKPPLLDLDVSQKLVTTEPPVPRRRETINADVLLRVSQTDTINTILKWNEEQWSYAKWNLPALSDVTGAVEVIGNNRVLSPEKISWNQTSINPFRAVAVEVAIKDAAGTPLKRDDLEAASGSLRLVWKSANQPRSWIDYSEGRPGIVQNNRLLFATGDLRRWLLNGKVNEIGVKTIAPLDGLRVGRILTITPEQLTPSIRLVADPAELFGDINLVPVVKESQPLNVTFDTRSIADAQSVKVVITKAGKTPSVYNAWQPLVNESSILLQKRLDRTSGTCVLSRSRLGKTGKHQVFVIALDKDGKQIGWSSEPRFFRIVK